MKTYKIVMEITAENLSEVVGTLEKEFLRINIMKANMINQRVEDE